MKDIEAVAFFKEVGDQDWRVSMRSKGNVDIGAIAAAIQRRRAHQRRRAARPRATLDAVYRQFGQLLAEAIRNK